MAITNNGMHIVTAAHDRSIRLWERTEEPLILDEEKEQVNFFKKYRLERLKSS
jgi:WD40 repeat protein